jgi:pimeloyl-ACP methyl ester carboxylesterase
VEKGELHTGSYRCRYFVWGHGPTLVCIPGLAADAITDVLLLAHLKSRFRCVSYDLPDGDRDGAHLTRYRPEDLTDDLFRLLDHLRIGECFLFASSFGGTIALSALARQPRRFPQAILQGSFCRRAMAPAEVFCAHWLRYLPGRVGNLPLIRRILHENHYEPFRSAEPAAWNFFLQQALNIPLRALGAYVLLLNRLDLRSLLPRIPQPVLMVCGDRDPLVGKGCEKELREGLPCVARAEIEHCGHYPQLTHPATLAEIVRQYLLPPSCPAHS